MGIGSWEILLILLVVLILFGAGRLPKVMKDFGSGIRGFKEGLSGVEDKDKAEAKISDESEGKK